MPHLRVPARALRAGLLALAALLACAPAEGAGGRSAAGPFAAQSRGSAHPHFDDRGTLAWHGSWAQASAAAAASGRLVFLDLGREACSGCRVLVEQVLPAPAVRERLARVAVGWAADADRQEPALLALRRAHLPHATVLPMLGFVTPEGRWVAGHEGRIEVGEFLPLLAQAEAALATTRRAPASLPAPRVRTPGATAPAARARALPAPAPDPAPDPAPAPAPGPAPADHGLARISGLRLHFADDAHAGDAPLRTERAPAPGTAPAPYAARAAPGTPLQPAPVRSTPWAGAARPGAGSFPRPPPLPPGISASAATPPPDALPALPTRPEALAELPSGSAGHELALEQALDLALRGRRGEARTRLEALRRAAPGTPGGREAQRGLDALGALDDLAVLQARDPATAGALRSARRAALRDTRWAVLF